jgi:hypothetical protein
VIEHPFVYLQKRIDLRDCCRNLLNLRVTQTQPDVLHARCGRCGRGHIKMRADPMNLQALINIEKKFKG